MKTVYDEKRALTTSFFQHEEAAFIKCVSVASKMKKKKAFIVVILMCFVMSNTVCEGE